MNATVAILFMGWQALLHVLCHHVLPRSALLRYRRAELTIVCLGVVVRLVALALFRYQVELTKALCMLLTDVVSMGLLLSLLKTAGKPPHAVVIYALSPLPIWLVASASPMLICVTLVLALFFCFERSWWPAGYLLLGLTVSMNVCTVALVPFVIHRKNLRSLPLALLFPLIAVFSLLDLRIFCSANMFTLQSLSADFLLTKAGSIPLWPYHLGDHLHPLWLHQSLMMAFPSAVLLGLGFAVWALKSDNLPLSFLLVWALCVFVLPQLQITSFVLIVALVTLVPVRCLSFAAAFAWLPQLTVTNPNLLSPQQATPILLVWLAVFVLLVLIDVLRLRQPTLYRHAVPRSVDIVVPTLNEENNLRDCLMTVNTAIKEAAGLQIATLVVDAGSTDKTVAIAEELGARVVKARTTGRGNQLEEGIEAGKGDIVLMLHADARMHAEALRELSRAIAKCPAVEWGILGHVYDQRNIKMRIIELSNRLRFHLMGVAFGDQGIFVRRDVLMSIGGMPRIRLMEDVELSLRLARAACCLSLERQLTVSTRRWEKKTFGGYTLMVLRLVSTFLVLRRLGVDMPRITGKMYAWYYHKKS